MNALLAELRPLLRSLAGLSFFMNLLFLTSAAFSLQVFDRVIPSQSQETLLVLLIGTGIALLILLVLDYVRSRLQGVVSNIVEERLSSPVVNAIVAQAARGSAGARAEGIRDIASLRNLFSATGLLALFDVPWLAIYVAVIFALHPALGIAAALFSLLMLTLAWLNDRLSRAPIEDVQCRGRRAHQFVETSLRNAEVLQALGMTGSLLARWQTLQGKTAAVQWLASRQAVTFSAGTRFLRQAIQIVMLALGAYLVLAQEASAGVMIATTILLGRALQPVEQLVASWRALSEGRAAYRRLRDLVAEIDEEPALMELPRPQGSLGVEGLAFRPRGTDKLVLLNITFALEAGETLAVVGPSAAGKSTLARLLTGIWRPTSGIVRFDGADVARWPRQQLGPWIGYVPQDVELFDGSVAENIARLGEVDGEAVVIAAKRAHAHHMILDLPQGYDTPTGEQGLMLSPGQRQRVALARALYGDPRLVVLDEPNSNLDGAGEMALAAALSALRRAHVTTIVVTHRPSLIAHVDKILVLEGGRMQQFGPAGEVMKGLQRSALPAVAAAKAA